MDPWDHFSDEELEAIANGEKVPRSHANNNPGNLEDGKFARGLPGYKGSDGRFAVFKTPEDGYNAQVKLLEKRYNGRSIQSLLTGVGPAGSRRGGYAPLFEDGGDNSPAAIRNYVAHVVKKTGLDPTQPIPADKMRLVAHAMNEFEGGRNAEYDERVVTEGYQPEAQAQPPQQQDPLAPLPGDPNDEQGWKPGADVNWRIQNDGRPVNDAQQKTLLDLNRNEKLTPDAPVGSPGWPYTITDPDQVKHLKPGMFFIDPDGKYGQVPPNPEDSWGSVALGVVEGIRKPIDNAARGLEWGINQLGGSTDGINRALGLPTMAEAEDEHTAYLAEAARNGYVPNQYGQMAGEVGSMLLPGAALTKALGGGKLAMGAVGAAEGALLTDENTVGGVAQDAAIGATAGVVGQKLVDRIGRIFSPKIDEGRDMLMNMGVKTTPGQSMGGAVEWVENKVGNYLPFGQAAHNRSIDSFGVAALNERLAANGINPLPNSVSNVRDGLRLIDDTLPSWRQQAGNDPAAIRQLDDLEGGLGEIRSLSQRAGARAHQGNFTPNDYLGVMQRTDPNGARQAFGENAVDVLGAGRQRGAVGPLTSYGVPAAAAIPAVGNALGPLQPVVHGLAGVAGLANTKAGSHAVRQLANPGNRTAAEVAIGNTIKGAATPVGVGSAAASSQYFDNDQPSIPQIDAMPRQQPQAQPQPQQKAPEPEWRDPDYGLSEAELEAIARGD